MKRKLTPTFLVWLCASAFLFTTVAAHSQSGEMKLRAQLIWGTNEAKSPDPKHQPVGKELERKLKTTPFKWEHYYVVSREDFSVPLQKEKTVTMSKDCQIAVKNLGNSQIEFRLYGKRKLVNTITQTLPKNHLLVEGGPAENSTAWFVVLKQAD